MSVWIAQCLCPARHAILAAVDECPTPAHVARLESSLRARVTEWIKNKTLNPWCGICHAPVGRWRYEVGRSKFASYAEAQAAMKKTEAENIATGMVLGEILGPKR